MAESEARHQKRLDQKVIEHFPELSRTTAARLITEGNVWVNGTVITKPGYKLHAEDNVSVSYDPLELSAIPHIDLEVLYEDDSCVVILKPSGVLTHSKGKFNPEATVASWLSSRITENMRGERGGIVHRLDRATSGIIICAKTPTALQWLQKQFSTRAVRKVYFAIVSGHMPHEHAIIDMPIARNPKRPQTFKTTSTGKLAQTEYWVREQTPSYSLLELNPRTGRTHQLRVHLSSIGHPIVGDSLYGGAKAERLYLHATQLELILPDKAGMAFQAPLPGVFRAMMDT